MNKVSKKVVVGNLKMNGSLDFNEKHFNQIKIALKDVNTIDIGICVSYPYLFQAQMIFQDSNISWGSQNVAKDEKGPFTGEVSVAMLTDFNAKYAIVGHSERSTAYCESDENIATKFSIVKSKSMTPLLCVGETLIEREAGIMERVVANQIETIRKKYGTNVFKNSIIAYEPIWAIGSDLAASPEQADHMCNFIRNLIHEDKNNSIDDLKIIYGGSVNSKNALQLCGLESVDGALIGRGSLNAEEFIKICQIVNSI